eukprot:SAG11_NODE_193_length_12862_cov_7.128888_10_plen_103_part_00
MLGFLVSSVAASVSRDAGARYRVCQLWYLRRYATEPFVTFSPRKGSSNVEQYGEMRNRLGVHVPLAQWEQVTFSTFTHEKVIESMCTDLEPKLELHVFGFLE